MLLSFLPHRLHSWATSNRHVQDLHVRLPTWGPVFACVLGDIEMVRPLGLAGIPCATIGSAGSASLYSRFTRKVIHWEKTAESPDELVNLLMRFANAQPEPPVLFYQEDWQLRLVSRYRERLSRAFRFVLADPVLVEDLVDKDRFRMLAERLELPVPRTCRLHPIPGSTSTDAELPFPIIVKPLTRNEAWRAVGGSAKAIQIDTPEEFALLWPRLVEARMDLLAQEMIPGPETCIESYHVYVDKRGRIVAEFTGRKIRTYPAAYGFSTALTITDEPDTAALGRAVVGKLGLRGVAKLDFKRAPDGRLYLLEVNPRFNLWHHLGAVAGVNLPALVYADLVGKPRPAIKPARAGARWCLVPGDWPAAKAQGVSFPAWLAQALRSDATLLDWTDPAPIMRSTWYWRDHVKRVGATRLHGALSPVASAANPITAVAPSAKGHP